MKMLNILKSRPLVAVAVLTAALSIQAGASVIDIGTAAGYSVLVYNSSNNSDMAAQGAPIGVVNGNWTQSGGQQTNTQQTTTVYLSPGFTLNGPPSETAVYDGPKLAASWAAAQTASSNFAALAPTQVIGAVTGNMTISEAAVGNYVFSISSISLNHTSLTLSAPKGSTYVLNISGDVTINGAGGSGILLAGGLTTNDVVYNFTGGGSLVTSGGMNSSGGGGGSLVQGIVLNPNGTVALHPGEVQGEVIAKNFSSSSATQISVPPSVPEASTLLPLAGVLGMAVVMPMLRRKRALALETVETV